MLVAAADGTEGNPFVAFLFISAAIMGTLPGFLSAFEGKAVPVEQAAARAPKKKGKKLF